MNNETEIAALRTRVAQLEAELQHERARRYPLPAPAGHPSSVDAPYFWTDSHPLLQRPRYIIGDLPQNVQPSIIC
jgi:hypothetical protein